MGTRPRWHWGCSHACKESSHPPSLPDRTVLLNIQMSGTQLGNVEAPNSAQFNVQKKKKLKRGRGEATLLSWKQQPESLGVCLFELAPSETYLRTEHGAAPHGVERGSQRQTKAASTPARGHNMHQLLSSRKRLWHRWWISRTLFCNAVRFFTF